MKKDEKKNSGSSSKILIFILLLLLAGGGFLTYRHLKKAEKPEVFNKIEAVSGSASCVIPGEKFTVTIQALNDAGMPFKSCRIAASPTVADGCTITPQENITDAGGIARFDVIAGKITGDNYIRFTPLGSDSKSIEIRFTNGVKLLGANQEGQAGKQLNDPVGVKLMPEANPAPESKSMSTPPTALKLQNIF